MNELPPATLALRIREQLELLREILIREDEKNWLRGLDLCIARLPESPANDDACLLKLRDVAAIYRSMTAGAGSFADFHVWRSDFEERVRLNRQLGQVRNQLWLLLEEAPH